MKYKCIKEQTGFMAHKGDIYNERSEHIINKNNDELCHVNSHYGRTLFEKYKPTPYEYLIEYYGLEEDKIYNYNGEKVTILNGCIIKKGLYLTYSTVDNVALEILQGNATFTEIPQKKTSLVIGGEHYSIGDDKLEQIKKIIE